MKQVLVSANGVTVEDVPAPQPAPGCVLVGVVYSCISAGTELSSIRHSRKPLWKKALEQPEKVGKIFSMVADAGLQNTVARVRGKLAAAHSTGYSAAGTVLAVGEGVHDIQPGDRVACAGAQCAHHAEVICVPRNLTVPVPESLSLDQAATVTLGAIALQGVRRAQPTLGETFVVVGLGILGQLTALLLQANGCRVIGLDPDRRRVELARQLGMENSIDPAADTAVERALRLTGGHGVDAVIITAATPAHDVVATAFNMCRRKARVVLVGDVGLHLNRDDFYAKELDFLISTSYGPGRYDQRYEEEGLEYPIGYVRWTENRNMAEFLRLAATGKLSLQPLVQQVYPIAQAPAAYAQLQNQADKPLIVLLAYPEATATPARTIVNPGRIRAARGRTRLAVIGAGDFAKGVHLPNLTKLADLFTLHTVMSRSGHNAAGAARQFQAQAATTDYESVLNNPEIDAVLICTRHNQHAAMTLAALQAGKHVLVEKPLALTAAELDQIAAFYRQQPNGPLLLTGFNRRFAPLCQQIHAKLARRTNPLMITYRMNAGHIPADHWVHGADGGGRNLGEACHIYDLFTYLTGSRVVDVNTQALCPATTHYSRRDNFATVMRFADGSVASLAYTALGCRDYPKEQMEVFCDGIVLHLNDYRSVNISGSDAKFGAPARPDKGHLSELRAFGEALNDASAWPIPLWQQLQATQIALEVETALGGAPSQQHAADNQCLPEVTGS